jgi:hypothetical protein
MKEERFRLLERFLISIAIYERRIMKRYWTILLALFFLVPALAQEDAASVAFERLIPGNVRLRLNEETGASLIFNANPAVCERLITDVSIEGRVIDVDAYVPLSAEGANCNFIAPFEPVIELGELEPDTSYVLLLNDFATSFFVPQPEAVLMDMPFPMVWGEDNALFGFTRVDTVIESVDITDADDVLTVTMRGSHPDGCQSEAFIWLRQDDFDQNTYHIEVFRLIPEGVMCPAELQEFAMTFSTELDADGNYYLEVSEQWFSYSRDVIGLLRYLPLVIESVSVVANGDDYDVTVNAMLPDCGVDLSRIEASEDYASFISLILFIPRDNDCSNAETPHEELFTVAMLPVIINGVAYDENGILSPDAQAAETRPDPGQGGGGNLMQVDTVIESVDVLVLESFPMQLNLVVKGYQPDGCELPVIVEQQREGNLVTVHIYRELPPDVMCTMIIVPYEETIQIEGGFEGGTIEIRVNEFSTTVDL